MATWRNGYAEDCKSFYPSSILGVASKHNKTMDKEILNIALNSKNLSFLPNHTHYTKLKNKACGDEIKIYLIVKKGKIVNFKEAANTQHIIKEIFVLISFSDTCLKYKSKEKLNNV